MKSRRPTGATVPTESDDQQMLFEWAEYAVTKYPSLGLLFHIPNEGRRSWATGTRMRREGLRKGVPDICLPVARKGYNAMYIELKRTRGGRVSEEQQLWINALNRAGNYAVVCKGFDAAREALIDYLT